MRLPLDIYNRHGERYMTVKFDRSDDIEWINVYVSFCDEWVRIDLKHECPNHNFLIERCHEALKEERERRLRGAI